MMRRRSAAVVALLLGVNCGSRSGLERDERASGAGASLVGGAGVGGSPSGGNGNGGGSLHGLGGKVVDSGGRSSSGGSPSGGDASPAGGQGGEFGAGGSGGLGGDGSGGSSSCDPAFECRGLRSYMLMESAWGQLGPSFRPRAARCIDYSEDDAIDLFDYLALLDEWWNGCPEVGLRAAAGSCFYPGDINSSGCLDLDDYAAIQSAAGKEAVDAHPCADLSEDGFIDDIDLAFLLRGMPSLGCAGVELDPVKVLGNAAGQAASCDLGLAGDINGDGIVDFRDLSGVLSHLGFVGERAPECLDINRDESIDLADALHVLHLSLPSESSCREDLDALDDFISQHRACNYDTDCQILSAGCSQMADHCSRSVYVNLSVDSDSLSVLQGKASACLSLNSCSKCTATAPEPRCIAGMCAPGQ